MNSLKKSARTAGFLYLAYFVAFFVADNGVHYTAVGTDDLATIAHNMMASEWLFRIGFVSFLLAAVFFLLSAWALYVLLRSVNQDLALLLSKEPLSYRKPGAGPLLWLSCCGTKKG